MSPKPTPASVTDVPCDCGYLERQAAEPGSPIRFDGKVGEYQILRDGGGSLLIRHCPWCGGTAPESQRHRSFAILTMGEINRLVELTAPIGSVEDAVARFGPPDEDHPRGLIVHMPATGDRPERAESFRTLRFGSLSETADVILVDEGIRGIRWQYGPKSLGGD